MQYWTNSDPDSSWGDDAEAEVAAIATAVQAVFHVPLEHTFVTSSEAVDTTDLAALWERTDKTKLPATEVYPLYEAVIDGHTVIGSNWDGIVWLVSPIRFVLN